MKHFQTTKGAEHNYWRDLYRCDLRQATENVTSDVCNGTVYCSKGLCNQCDSTACLHHLMLCPAPLWSCSSLWPAERWLDPLETGSRIFLVYVELTLTFKVVLLNGILNMILSSAGSKCSMSGMEFKTSEKFGRLATFQAVQLRMHWTYVSGIWQSSKNGIAVV